MNRFLQPKLILLIFITLLFAFGLLGCGSQSDSQATTPTKKQGALVDSAIMQSTGQDYALVAEGFLQATNQIRVVSEVSGLVVEKSEQMFAGGIIESGAVMVQIEKNIYAAEQNRAQAQVESSIAAVRNAELNFNRLQVLANKESVSDADLDQAETDLIAARAAVKQARAALALADERLADTGIEAPFRAGVISEHISVGAFVSAGQELAEIYDLSEAEMIVGVAQSQAGHVINAFQNGFTKATIMRQDGEVLFEGEIQAVVPQLDQASRTVNFRITIADAFITDSMAPSVLLGEFLKVKLTASSEEAVYSAARSTLREERYVYVIQADNTLKKMLVKPLSRTDDEVFFNISDPDILSQMKQQGNQLRLLKTDLPESYEGLKVRLSESTDSGVQE